MDIICEEPVLTDAMEHILGEELHSVFNSDNLHQDAMELLMEMTNTYVLVTPYIDSQLKHCSVKLTRIDNELSYLPGNKLCTVVTPSHRPHTHSKCAPKPVPTRRRPRSAHTQSSYCEPELTSDEEPKAKRDKPTPSQGGPSEN